MTFYAAHKLISDVDNKVTFYLDTDFKTDFMDQLVLDCKALATNEVKTTTSKVTTLFRNSYRNSYYTCGGTV